jgi:putative hydrolase of the HAD superfamily
MYDRWLLDEPIFAWRNMQNRGSAGGAKVQVRALIFDYGNVLCHPQQASDVEGMAAVCGMEVSRFRDLYWKFRMPYDRGDLNGESYWSLFTSDLFASDARSALSREQVAQLILLDTSSWTRPNEASVRWVEQLHRAGVPLALLSNMPFELSRHLSAHCDWVSYFDHLVFSCQVGSVKPEPAIYRRCLEKLDFAPQELLFLDDIAANVEGASKLGIHGLVFDTLESTRARVQERFELVGSGAPERLGRV